MAFVQVEVELCDLDEEDLVSELKGRGYFVSKAEVPPDAKSLQQAILSGDMNRITEIAREHVRAEGLLA